MAARFTCETSQVLLVGGQAFFLGDFPFLPHLTIDPAQMCEIILTGRNTTEKKTTKKKTLFMGHISEIYV